MITCWRGFFWGYYAFLHTSIWPMIVPSSRIGTTWRSKKFLVRSFSKSCILWLKNFILNWSLSFFQMNSRLWMKWPIINTHHDFNILYTSPNKLSTSSMCSRTKKLVARSNDASSKGRVSSKLQTIFSTFFPECLFSNFSAISQATYLSGFSGARNLCSLPSPAPRSMICKFSFPLGRNLTKTPFSKLSRCLWYAWYCSAIVLYPVFGSWIRICFWL